MSLWRTIQIALRSLVAHKLRSLLTMLGIVIGTACVIALVSIGDGFQARTNESMTKMGSNLLFVRPSYDTKKHVHKGAITTLTAADADAIRAEFPSEVVDVAPQVVGSKQVKYFEKNVEADILGTTPAYQEVRNFHADEGRYFTWDDLRMRRRVCVIGVNIAQKLFGGGSPVGQEVKVGGSNFEVLGVLEEKGENWNDPDDMVIVPLTTAQRLIYGREYIEMITIEARSTGVVDHLIEDIKTLLRERHALPPDAEDDFFVHNQQEFLNEVRGIMTMITALLLCVAAISLVVGGIGIMNIMFVTVTERTREIGTRKALGARRIDILQQFLVEAVVVSLCGGAIGIGLGAGVSWGVAQVVDWDFILRPATVALAAGTSAAIGVIFGVFPAAKAAWLDPIEALRFE